MYVFLKEEGNKNGKQFSEIEFLIKLEYLCDIFDKLKALNIFILFIHDFYLFYLFLMIVMI